MPSRGTSLRLPRARTAAAVCAVVAGLAAAPLAAAGSAPSTTTASTDRTATPVATLSPALQGLHDSTRRVWRAARRVQKRRSTPAYSDRVGFSGSVVWYGEAEQLAYLRRLRELGARWIREDLHWGAFERSPGRWDWTVGDRLMRNASLAGVNVLGVVSYSAGWAASGATIYHPPRRVAAYAEFCRRLAERYGPHGSFWRAHPELSPRPVKALEIWNEPWAWFFWKQNPDPAAYVELLRAAATAIRSADRDVDVLASADIFQMRSDTRASLDWFRLLLQRDPALFRNLVDAYSVHAYTQRRGPHDTSVVQRWRYDRVLMTRDLAARAGASHPIWITEFGWTTESRNADAVSEATQARYLSEALERALGPWQSFVARSFVYHWGRPESDNVGGYGVFRRDGTKKPAWDSLHALLHGA
jgi:polysaccharide biosynthesis protein PslG